MEKRTIIAIVLSVVVLYAYSFIMPPPPKQPASAPAPVASPAQVTASAPDVAPKLPVTLAPLPMATAQQGEVDVTVDTDLYSAVFTSKGGALKSFRLKNYREKAVAGSPQVAVFTATTPESVSLVTESKEFGLDSGLNYAVSTKSVAVSGSAAAQLEFTAVSATGVSVRKTYSIVGNSYSLGLSHQVANGGAARVTGPLQLLLRNRPIDPKGESRYEVQESVVFLGGKASHISQKDVNKEPKTFVAGSQWTTYGDKYFLTAVMAADQAGLSSVEVRDAAGLMTSRIGLGNLTLDPGQSIVVSQKVFVGPKDIDILKSYGSQLEEVIDLGWFSAIAKPFLFTLKFFYKYVGNYGLAIIIITVILKILFFPLTHKSYKSMKAMQKLQPQMEKLKEKFKNDRTAMNQEVMKLYQEHKVNPLGGCLPMVVQIPVFFALYKALMFSIELRHAPFYFWITDLSSKDPYYVTPIVMGATMFIQQKMTPTSMDPVQAKMMLMLPIVFTFMFLSFPSGLVLYWLVNNVLSIAQQYYINKSVAV